MTFETPSIYKKVSSYVGIYLTGSQIKQQQKKVNQIHLAGNIYISTD